jgi:hypothetical protein
VKIINLFDFLFSYTLSFNKVSKQFKLDKLFRFIIILFVNIYVHIYFRIFNNKFIGSNNKFIRSNNIIINLTTFPARIKTVWIIIEILLRQTVKAEKIILWLSDEQFNSLDSLPRKLRRLQSSIFEIKICKGDLRSHKKYYYALKENPNYLNITVDDDILYPSTLIEKLLDLHNLFPTAICCHRAKKVSMFDTLDKYNSWKEAVSFCGPTNDLFFTSGGGTLFPPHSLHSDVCKEELFMFLCRNADDIWLNTMAYLNETKIVKSDYFSLCLPLRITNNIELSFDNLTHSQNDVQLQEVKKYYDIK